VTHYSDNPGHVRADFFKKSGKWYMTETIDMSDYYFELDIYEAVRKALADANLAKTHFTIVILEPYHQNDYPICIPATE
jgi:hypothetical protein